jgi:GT2 family glycosyltransferase
VIEVKKMDLVCAFIILHYNSYEATKVCVDSILGLDKQECVKVIVIDNSSANDSYKKLCETYSGTKVELLQTEYNCGFSAANNIAYEYCKKKYDCDFVIFANNDLEFIQKDFVKRIYEEYQNSKFAVVGPDIYNPIIDTHQSPISYEMQRSKSQVKKTIIFNRLALTFFDLYYMFFGKSRNDKPEIKDAGVYQENVIPLGACLVISKKLLKKKSVVFSPETFFYYEEYILADWCLKNNEKMVYQPAIKVKHYHGMATKTVGNAKQSELFRMKNIYNSSKIYYKQLQMR